MNELERHAIKEALGGLNEKMHDTANRLKAMLDDFDTIKQNITTSDNGMEDSLLSLLGKDVTVMDIPTKNKIQAQFIGLEIVDAGSPNGTICGVFYNKRSGKFLSPLSRLKLSLRKGKG